MSQPRAPYSPRELLDRSTPESQIQAASEVDLAALGAVWGGHIPAIAYSGARCVGCGRISHRPAIPAGILDTFGVFRGAPGGSGLFVWLECKREAGTLSDEQRLILTALGPTPRAIVREIRPSTYEAVFTEIAVARP